MPDKVQFDFFGPSLQEQWRASNAVHNCCVECDALIREWDSHSHIPEVLPWEISPSPQPGRLS